MDSVLKNWLTSKFRKYKHIQETYKIAPKFHRFPVLSQFVRSCHLAWFRTWPVLPLWRKLPFRRKFWRIDGNLKKIKVGKKFDGFFEDLKVIWRILIYRTICFWCCDSWWVIAISRIHQSIYGTIACGRQRK